MWWGISVLPGPAWLCQSLLLAPHVMCVLLRLAERLRRKSLCKASALNLSLITQLIYYVALVTM